MVSIYVLVDPRDRTVHYVGMTEDTYARLNQHLSLTGTNRNKNQWLYGLEQAGLQPRLVVVEEVETRKEAFQREAYWTKYYSKAGHPLTNLERTRLLCSIPCRPCWRDNYHYRWPIDSDLIEYWERW